MGAPATSGCCCRVRTIFWAVLQEESLLSLSLTWAFGSWMLKTARITAQMSGAGVKIRPCFLQNRPEDGLRGCGFHYGTQVSCGLASDL